MYRNQTGYLLCKYGYRTFQHVPSFLQYCGTVNVQCRYKSFRKAFQSISKPTACVKESISETALQNGHPATISSLVKPAIFTVMFSTAAFAGATIWQYENMKHRAKRIDQIIRTPQKWLSDALSSSHFRIQWKFNGSGSQKKGFFREVCNTWWNSLTEGQKVFVPILMSNVLVYLAWKVPYLRTTMSHYFVSNPSSKAVCWPMFLSTFSHYSGIHLMANMFVLNSFISNTVSNLGSEQFLAFYCSAGVFSSFVSLAHKVLSRDIAVSLGASGAIMAILGYTCNKYPDTLLSIIFLPFFVFKAGIGIKVLMAADFGCLLMKFKIFDHAAHLGGALFGIFWLAYGNKYIWQNRGPFLEWWHKQRSRAQ